MPSSNTRTVQVAGRGSVVVPEDWSDNAATILLTKYCRSFKDLFNESSADQVFERLVDFWVGIKEGELPNYWYANPKGDPKTVLAERLKLKAELLKLLVEQKAAPNSPQFFNAGINSSHEVPMIETDFASQDVIGVVDPSVEELWTVGRGFLFNEKLK